jgi:hypothetical protein
MESTMTFLIFVTWLFLAAVVGVFASQRRKRSGFGWFVLAVLISPVLAFLLVAAMNENTHVPLSVTHRRDSNGRIVPKDGSPERDWRIPDHVVFRQ